MIIWTKVDIKQLIKDGKNYLWPRPACCSLCGRGLWGHGYVQRYFEEAEQACWIKRYRCPDCHQVITMRPEGYWPKFYHIRQTIHWVLSYHQKKGHWPAKVSRQTGGHWKRNLKSQVEKVMGLTTKLFPTGFKVVIERGLVPVSRSSMFIPQRC